MSDLDARVADWILDMFRRGELDRHWDGDEIADERTWDHLRACQETSSSDAEAVMQLWYDTGVEATVLSIAIRCPHVDRAYEVSYGELGELPDMLERFDAWLSEQPPNTISASSDE